MSPRPRWLVRSARGGVALLAVLLLGAGGLYGLFNTRVGLDFLADRIGEAASDENMTVRIAGLEDVTGPSIRVARVSVADREGVFFAGEDIRIDWRPLALFGGRIDIDAVTIARVDISRLPQAPQAAETEIPMALAPPFDIDVGHAAVEEIAVAANVLGTPQPLSATASFALAANLSRAVAKLDLARTDGGSDKAKVAVEYGANPARFAAAVRIDEPAGGLLARLAGLPRGDRLFVDLSGEGPPDAWRGRLKIEAGHAASSEAAVRVALRDSAIAVGADGTATFGGLLPAELLPFLSPAMTFETEAEVRLSGDLSVQRFQADSAVLSVSGSGEYRNGEVSASAKAKTHPGETPVVLLQDLSVGQASAEFRADGPADAPHVNLSFAVAKLAAGVARAVGVSGSATLVPGDDATFDLVASARVDGLDTGGMVPDGSLGSGVDLKAAGAVKRDGTVPKMKVSIVSGDTTAEAEGRLDAAGQAEGSYAFRLAQVERVARSAGLPLRGTFDVEGTYTADLQTRAVHVVADGALAGLSAMPPALEPLLGDRVPFAGMVEWRDGAPLTVVGLTVTPRAGQLEASGSLDVQTGEAAANVNAGIRDLNALSRLAGAPLAGSASLTGSIEGPLSSLSARGQASVANLQVLDFPVGDVGIGYAAQQRGQAVQLGLRIGGRVAEKTLAGGLNAYLEENAVRLSDIDIAVGRNSVAGAVGLDLTARRLSGALRASLVDLGDLPGTETAGLKGAGEIDFTAEGDNEVSWNASLRDVRVGADDRTIGEAAGRGTVADPLGQPSFSGAVDLRDIRAGIADGGKAMLEFNGTEAKIGWSAAGSLEGAHPVSVSATGEVAPGAGGGAATVATLEGEFHRQKIALQQPFAVSWRGADWRIEPIDLSVAGGRLQANGSSAGGVIEAAGKAEAIPLSLLSLVDPRIAVNGNLGAEVSASGTLENPRFSLSLAAHDVRPHGVEEADFSGFEISAAFLQEAKSADVTLSLAGPDETRMNADLKTQPFVRLDGGPLANVDALPLSGQVDATGRLGLIDALVGLGEDRLGGSIEAQAKIAGTIGTPDVRGALRLSKGFYEGAVTGTVLRDIEGEIVFTGDSATLSSLTADDGAEGRLSGAGSVRLTGANPTTEGMKVTLERFTALRHPLAQVVSSGTLSLSGSLEAPSLSGKLTVDRADIRIPDELPESVVALDVQEINALTGEAARRDGSREPSAGALYPVVLDVAIAFPGQSFVRGRGLESEWKGNLSVRGTSKELLISGKLDAVRGTFAFAGKTFVVKSGSVFLPDVQSSEPEIDATAEAKLSDITAIVRISGGISKPSIEVTSDPPLPQEEVLSQILFGRSTGQLSAVQAAQLAQTAATLSGKGGTGIVDKVRQALGVDVLNVETSEEEGRGASLKAGKYLTEDVFLSVSQGTEPNSQKVGVEVQVLPNITVESDISGAAESNIGVNWKFDY